MEGSRKKDGTLIRQIDEEERARIAGYRNFTSFAFSKYYAERCSLYDCGEMLGFSAMKMRTSLLTRNWPVRTRKQMVKKKKSSFHRSMFFEKRVKTYTPFIFPWCALYFYYIKLGLTTYEVAGVFKISQTSICALLRKYKIKTRKRGTKK